MNFDEEVQKLSVQIQQRKSHITNEEMTKHSLIIPFIQLLGFDIFNPLEVQPEYTADFGKKKGEKVDYAVFKNSKIIMFIEAKPVGSRLDNHNAQLSRYFNSTPELKLAIITDGVKYNFFSDVKQINIMDTTPFFEFDFSSISPADTQTLSQFQKKFIENNVISKLAEDLSSVNSIQEVLRNLFDEPSDEFIKLIIRQTGKTRLTNGAIDRYRPLVKDSLLLTLSEIFNEISKEVLQPNTSKTMKTIPKPTHSIQPSSCQIIQEKPVIIAKEKLRQEMHDIEQRVFARVEKLLEVNENDVSMLDFQLLPDQLVFIFNNYEFLRFKEGDQCQFSSYIDVSKASEVCPYYPISSENKFSVVSFSSPADISNLKQFIIASLEFSLKNNPCLQ